MPLDPFALAAAASCTAGCASIHALRRHADAVTLVLTTLACGLAIAVTSLLSAHGGTVAAPDVGGWMVVATVGG